MVNTRWYTQARVDEIVAEKDREIARLRSLWPTNGLGMETNVHQLVKNHRAWTERAIERADAAEAEVKKLRRHLSQTIHTLRLRTKAMHRVLKKREAESPTNDDRVVVLDTAHVGMAGMAGIGHVHDLDGRCVRRRAGELCQPDVTSTCEHWGHAEGEWKWSCCACSGQPNGCDNCS